MLRNFQNMSINEDVEMGQPQPITTEDILKKLLFDDDSSRPEVNEAVKIILEKVPYFRCDEYPAFIKLANEIPGYRPYESRTFQTTCLARLDDREHLIRQPTSFQDLFTEIATLSSTNVAFAMADRPHCKSDTIQRILGLQAQSTLYFHALRFIEGRFHPLFQITTWENILRNDADFTDCYDLRWGKKNARSKNHWDWDGY